MTDLITRLRVIMTAAVTWLVLVSSVLTVVAGELAAELGVDHPAVTWIARILVWLAVATTIIRRVTPVLKADRGILPPPPSPAPSHPPNPAGVADRPVGLSPPP